MAGTGGAWIGAVEYEPLGNTFSEPRGQADRRALPAAFGKIGHSPALDGPASAQL